VLAIAGFVVGLMFWGGGMAFGLFIPVLESPRPGAPWFRRYPVGQLGMVIGLVLVVISSQGMPS
jgi:hypothetical protein